MADSANVGVVGKREGVDGRPLGLEPRALLGGLRIGQICVSGEDVAVAAKSGPLFTRHSGGWSHAAKNEGEGDQ